MPAQPTAPNSELTAESVKLLKAGDVLRHSDGRTGFYQSGTVGITVRSVYNGLWVFWPIEDQVTFIGRPDADGWIPHDGGPNPVGDALVEAKERSGEINRCPADDIAWRNIIAFRLAAPSAERAEGLGSFSQAKIPGGDVSGGADQWVTAREAFFDLIADARRWEETGDEDGFHYELHFGHHSLLPLMAAFGVECVSYPIDVDGEIFRGTETPAEALYRASNAALATTAAEPGTVGMSEANEPSKDHIIQRQGEEIERLRGALNTPEVEDFAQGVVLEAQHQRERWGASHDAGKEPLDWFWLIGYLAQKAATAHIAGNIEKACHHTISTAAALANWHAAITGANTEMRPGIDAARARQGGPGHG